MANGKLHIRLAKLAKDLEHYGVIGPLGITVAAGMVYMLLNWCWQNLTDIVGSGDDVDNIVGNVLPKGVAGRLLYKSKWLSETKGKYCMPSAYVFRPLHVDKQWKRLQKESFTCAKKRSPALKIDFLFDYPDPDDTETNETKKKTGIPGYTEILKYWFEKWQETEGKGLVPYPFTGMDGKIIKRLISKVKTIDQLKSIIDRYLSLRDKWYAGKPLRKLEFELPKFLSETATETNDIRFFDKNSSELPRL